MQRTRPAVPRAVVRRRPGWAWTALLAAALVCSAVPLAGCVEVSRTEKSRFGNPLQSHSAGPRNQFDAENFKPPTGQQKPWYQRLFDW